jgi:hypothetical protein
MASRSIGEFELAILLTIGLLRDDACGVALHAAVSKRLRPRVLDRRGLHDAATTREQGLRQIVTSDPTPVGGGRAKRYFELTRPVTAPFVRRKRRRSDYGAAPACD